MSARHALYFAPAPDDPLHAAASAWLGRDAAADVPVARIGPPGLDDLDLEALTAEPRRYGFHATLKAPFELAEGRTEDQLLAAFQAFCDARAPFEASISVQPLSAFVAFRLDAPSPAMQALHEACVRDFEAFRAPLGARDLSRRRAAGLTPDQDARLLAWGYPHVFEAFTFHMTLTGRIADEATRARVSEALHAHFAPLSGRRRFDGLSLFRQTARDAPFTMIAQAPFAADPDVASASVATTDPL